MTANKLGWSAQPRARLTTRYTQSEVDKTGAVSVSPHLRMVLFRQRDEHDDAVGQRIKKKDPGYR